MKKYKLSILILSICISIPSSFFIFLGFYKMNISLVIIWTLIMLISWAIFFQLKNDKKYFFWISFIPIAIMWIILFIQEIKRILFILENNGMELASGEGSPMAFLIGIFFELIFFLPLTYSIIAGILYIKNRNKINL